METFHKRKMNHKMESSTYRKMSCLCHKMAASIIGRIECYHRFIQWINCRIAISFRRMVICGMKRKSSLVFN